MVQGLCFEIEFRDDKREGESTGRARHKEVRPDALSVRRSPNVQRRLVLSEKQCLSLVSDLELRLHHIP